MYRMYFLYSGIRLKIENATATKICRSFDCHAGTSHVSTRYYD
jgi:hypothetical protein